MQNKFAEAMSKCSNAELIKIVGKLREEYQPEAVIAAEIELEKRKVSGQIIVKDKKEKKKGKLSLEEKANLPLDVNSKILTLLFPRPARFLTDYWLKDEGYLRQYREWRQWTIVGIIFYLVIFILVILIAILV